MMPEIRHHANVRVCVPRGIEGYWQIILELDRTQGEFTIGDVNGETWERPEGARLYLHQLVKGGIAKIVKRVRISGRSVPVFALLSRPKRTPRFSRRRGGVPIYGTQQEHIWTAIRTLKQFGIDELCFAASTDEVKVTRGVAERYINHLERAGYITVTQARGPHRCGRWRLKPGMSTGPKPPRTVRVDNRAMFDPNLSAMVGDQLVSVQEDE